MKNIGATTRISTKNYGPLEPFSIDESWLESQAPHTASHGGSLQKSCAAASARRLHHHLRRGVYKQSVCQARSDYKKPDPPRDHAGKLPVDPLAAAGGDIFCPAYRRTTGRHGHPTPSSIARAPDANRCARFSARRGNGWEYAMGLSQPVKARDDIEQPKSIGNSNTFSARSAGAAGDLPGL